MSASSAAALRAPDAVCAGNLIIVSIDDCIAKCGWWDVEIAGAWYRNVTATISGDTVVVSAPTDARGCPLDTDAAPTGVRYLYADWPVATLYNKDGFPALPFVLNVTRTM